MVIAPATRLEQLVQTAYGAAPSEEFDIDLGSAVIANPLTATRAAPVAPPLPDMAALDPESIRLALTDLDDVRVEKDPSQSGQFANAPAPRARSAPPAPPRVRLLTVYESLDAAARALAGAATPDAAIEVAVGFLAGRWQTGAVLAVRDDHAVGVRGHKIAAPGALVVSLAVPSTVQRAAVTRRVALDLPAVAAQDALARALAASAPVAAPVLVDGKPIAVIVAGDPLGGLGDRDDAAHDLGKLAEAVAAAYRRASER
jgi:hypothetical protein